MEVVDFPTPPLRLVTAMITMCQDTDCLLSCQGALYVTLSLWVRARARVRVWGRVRAHVRYWFLTRVLVRVRVRLWVRVWVMTRTLIGVRVSTRVRTRTLVLDGRQGLRRLIAECTVG